jgi:hypothetical protein
MAAHMEGLSLTYHAGRRLQQRGVPYGTLALLLRHADTSLHAGDGCETLGLSRRAARDLIRSGCHPDDVTRAARLVVIVGRQGVVSVLRPARNGRGRCYRRQMQTRAARKS